QERRTFKACSGAFRAIKRALSRLSKDTERPKKTERPRTCKRVMKRMTAKPLSRKKASLWKEISSTATFSKEETLAKKQTIERLLLKRLQRVKRRNNASRDATKTLGKVY